MSDLADPYTAVLADLQAKRAQIDQTIELLTALREGRTPVAAPVEPSSPEQPAAEDNAGMFLGMSIVDASKKLLALRKRAMPNAEILAELRAGGLVLTGNDPLNVVSSVMTRRFNNVGDVVRVSRGTWGLKEWYPGRSFKTAGKATSGEASAGAAPITYHLQVNDLGGEARADNGDDDL